MQNKHRIFFHFKVDQLPGRGGVPPVGPKDQLFPFFFIEGSPKDWGLCPLELIQAILELLLATLQLIWAPLELPKAPM